MDDGRSGCRRGLGRAAAVVALAMAVAGGCAGQTQEKLSRTYMQAGDYDLAVEAAQEAVAKSPSNSSCLDQLADAQTAAADFHYEQASKLMATRQPGAAKVEVDRTLSYMPAHPGGNSLQIKVRQAVARHDELVGKAREAAAREDWKTAATLAEQACKVDEGSKPGRDLLAQAKSLEGRTAVAASPARVSAPVSPAQAQPGAMEIAQPPVVRSQPPLVEVVRAGATNPQAARENIGKPQPALISMDSSASRPASGGATFWTSEVRGSSRNEGGPRTIEIATQPAPAEGWGQRTTGEPAPVNRSRDWREAPVPGRIVTESPRQADREHVTGGANDKYATPRPAAQADRHLMVGVISRGDRRFKKIMSIMDGLTVKVTDTGSKPLDADLQIVAGKFKISPKDMLVGGSVKIQGISRRQYRLTILSIDHDKDTVRFAIDRVE